MPAMTHVPLAALSGIPFTKLCGSGNDFVGLDGREVRRPTREEIAALCDRRFGVGADGLVRLSPGTMPDHVRLEYWNSDGSDAALCGNGSLCSAVLARRLAIATSDRFTLETGAGAISARVVGDARAEIGVGSVEIPREARTIEREPGELAIYFATVGVPHLVVLVDDPNAIDLPRRGRMLRFHASLGSPGANVNFVARAPIDGRFALRTYERGVEGETLACGTGATATAVTLMTTGRASDRVELRPTGGSILAVHGRSISSRFEEVTLEGEGRVVFRGTIENAAARADEDDRARE